MRKKKPQTLKAAQRENEELRIALTSLLEAIDEHLGSQGSKKNEIGFLSLQLRDHIERGYPLPRLADLSIPQGAPITVVLRILVNACNEMKLSLLESEPSKSDTNIATE